MLGASSSGLEDHKVSSCTTAQSQSSYFFLQLREPSTVTALLLLNRPQAHKRGPQPWPWAVALRAAAHGLVNRPQAHKRGPQPLKAAAVGRSPESRSPREASRLQAPGPTSFAALPLYFQLQLRQAGDPSDLQDRS